MYYVLSFIYNQDNTKLFNKQHTFLCLDLLSVHKGLAHYVNFNN